MKTKIFILLFSACCFFACTKLDEVVEHDIASKDFYRNGDDLSLALTAVYKLYQEAYGGGDVYNYFMMIEVASETGAPTRTKNDPHQYNSWAYANNPDKTIPQWGISYKLINQANAVVDRGAAIEMDTVLKNRMFGEARFLRGLTYFHLLRLYGGVPIPDSYTQGLAGLEIPRKSTDEVYDYVIQDLQYAEAHLPVKSAYSGGEKWRTTKGAAQALLGKVYLYRASMTTDNGKKQEYFQASKDYSGKVISSNEYRLEPNVKDLWLWWNPNNKQGQESIFEIEFGYKGDGNESRLHIDGGINVTDPNLGSYMYYRFGPSFTAYDSFSDADKRKEATFLTSVTLSTGQTIQWLESNKGVHGGTTPGGWTSACPGNLKYYDPSAESAATGSPATNFYVIRYAEVLLNYAEAESELNQGPTADAYEKIDQVRSRAGIAGLTKGLSRAEFSDAVYQERVWEFIGEGQVYYDALRTDKLGALVEREVQEGTAEGLWLYSSLQFKPSKTFLWKIPTYDLNSNPALEQNADNISE